MTFPSKYKRIIQWSPPRTGSTLVWQILDALFEDPEYQENKWLHPNIVQKTHTLNQTSLRDPNVVFFTTVRNPIDSMVSYMIVKKEPFTKESILKHIDIYKSNFDLIPLVQKTSNHAILRYELFYDTFSVIFDAVETLFSITIEQSLRDTISSKFSRKQNKKIADGLSGFDVWEKNSFIHGDHINSESVSYWESRIPPEYHEMVIRGFLHHLNRWGYRDDWKQMLHSSVSLFQKKCFTDSIRVLGESIEILETGDSLYTLGKIHLSYASSGDHPGTESNNPDNPDNQHQQTHRRENMEKAYRHFNRLLSGSFTIRKEIEIEVLGYIADYHRGIGQMSAYAETVERLGKLSGESIQFCRAGYGYLKSNRLEDSIRCYYTSICIDGTNYFSYNNLAQVMSYIGSHHLTIHYREEAIKQVRRVLSGEVPIIDVTHDIEGSYPIIFSNLLLDLNYVSDMYSREYIYNRHLEYATIFEESLDYDKTIISTERSRDLISSYKQTGKIRVGYLSNDFKNHCIGSLVEGCFSNTNQELFDVFVYSNETTNDVVQQRLRSHPVTWRDVSGMTDSVLYEQIHRDSIHVMVDLSGHTGMNRLRMFCYRLAPIQVTYLAYPNTTGVQNMDYKFTDSYIKTDECDDFHTETLYELPYGIHNYKPDPDLFKLADRVQLDSSSHIRFGCFNNPAKMSDGCIKAFCDILKRVPNSTLFIRYHRLNSDFARHPFLSKCKKHGVLSDRFDIGCSPTKQEYIHTYNKIDLCLDTFPYGSHTTLCELLWMSVPIVTLKGESPVGRVGFSMLTHLGLHELVTETIGDYVDTCVSLAHNPTRLNDYHTGIRGIIKDHPMSDPVKFMASIETAYSDMWTQYMNTRINHSGKNN